MLYTIRNRSGDVIARREAESLAKAVEMEKARLSNADLSGANLSGANLFGADLSRANLSVAYLFCANLSRANLFGADLFCANLYGITMSWTSHDLIVAKLRDWARGNTLREMALGWILLRRDGCWGDSQALNFVTCELPEPFSSIREEILDELAKFVKDGDGAPDVLRERAERKE